MCLRSFRLAKQFLLYFLLHRTEAMTPPTDRWLSLPLNEIQNSLGEFTGWVLCGGRSLDWLLGTETRSHGDTDVGVFRSELADCLRSLEQRRVYLCDPPGQLVAWKGEPVPEHVHDIWITSSDLSHWEIQLMVYDDSDGSVSYRRDPRIHWPREAHAITVRKIRILNPLITLLFKLHRRELQEKDCRDVAHLITGFANQRLQSD